LPVGGIALQGGVDQRQQGQGVRPLAMSGTGRSVLQTNHRRPRLRRGMQGRVIAEAEIVAKPDDAGGSGMAGHQMG
jgi:hypothetical protein